MFKNKLSKRKFLSWILCLGLLWSGALGCGSASPPAGIPAPVSELMAISNPDASGAVTLSGAPGAVNGGADVTAANTSQGGVVKKLELLFYRIAFAQDLPISNTTTADSEGAFEMILRGEIGDTISVIQTVDGEDSPATELVITGDVVRLGAEPRHVATDDSGGLAYITSGPLNGNATDSSPNRGNVFALNFFGTTPPASLPQPTYFFDNFSGIGPIGLDLMNTPTFGVVTSFEQNQLRVFDLASGSFNFDTVVSPLDVAIISEFPWALIGVEDSPASIQVYDILGPMFLCSIEIPGTATHVKTPLVDAVLDEAFNLISGAVSQFDDGTWILSRVISDGCPPPILFLDQVPLPSSIIPGGLAFFNNADQALVTDAGSNQVYVADFLSKSLTPVTVGNNPIGVAVNSQTNKAYVVNAGDNSLSEIDLVDLSVKTKTGVGLVPTRIGLFPRSNQAVVLSILDQSVVLVDLNF